MISSIIFLVVERRSDIAFATLIVVRFAKNPGHQHTKAVKIILQYLKSSKKKSRLMAETNNLLKGISISTKPKTKTIKSKLPISYL